LPEEGRPARSHEEVVAREFERAAALFGERTQGRFDHMGVVEFARLRFPGVVAEVGAGTGNFLALFAPVARRLVAIDLTPAMLRQARSRHPGMAAIAGHGARLPLRSRSMDLVCTAQVLHHVPHPVPFVREMRRAARADGRVLVVDQAAPERFEEAVAMNELERLRDPSHAASRPPSALRVLLRAAGLEIEDERIVSGTQRFSNWMWPGEHPEERIDAVRGFIVARGSETGMGFERDGDDWVFERRRIMLLARRA
jgi:SAM-dependent methyltransferase